MACSRSPSGGRGGASVAGASAALRGGVVTTGSTSLRGGVSGAPGAGRGGCTGVTGFGDAVAMFNSQLSSASYI